MPLLRPFLKFKECFLWNLKTLPLQFTLFLWAKTSCLVTCILSFYCSEFLVSAKETSFVTFYQSTFDPVSHLGLCLSSRFIIIITCCCLVHGGFKPASIRVCWLETYSQFFYKWLVPLSLVRQETCCLEAGPSAPQAVSQEWQARALLFPVNSLTLSPDLLTLRLYGTCTTAKDTHLFITLNKTGSVNLAGEPAWLDLWRMGIVVSRSRD